MDFELDRDIRLVQVHTPGRTVVQQATADIALHLSGGKWVGSITFDADAKGFPGQSFRPCRMGALEYVFQVSQRVHLDPGEVGDTRHAGQEVCDRLHLFRLLARHKNLQFVPELSDLCAFVETPQ